MDKCKDCKHGIYAPIPDKQIGHEGKLMPNWNCNHPDDKIRKLARTIGFSQNCPSFEAK
jgi:hypothetical protein